MSEVSAKEGGTRSPGASKKSEGHVAGPAAEVEDGGIGTREDMGETACGAPPPESVDVEGKDVIEEIVARRDRAEHVAHSKRCGFLVVGV